LLAFAALFLGPEKGAGAQAEAQDGGAAERAGDAVVGASVAVPEAWSVERERYTSDGTYGFTLWKPREDPEAAHDHGGDPGVRVGFWGPRLASRAALRFARMYLPGGL